MTTRYLTRVRHACQRRAARWFGRRPWTLPVGEAVISFTFDDFPRSALLCGGEVLEDFGFAGTYYTALGLAHTRGDGGEHFRLSDLPRLLERKHELGCHTFHHLPASETPSQEFALSVARNAEALQQTVPGHVFRSHSYPISYPRPLTKRLLSRRFDVCRGGGQVANHGTVDLNYLSSFFLEQANERLEPIERVLRSTQRTGGWLIFSTHDIANSPSRFGCTPTFFIRVVQAVVRSGIRVLPVAAAWDRFNARARIAA